MLISSSPGEREEGVLLGCGVAGTGFAVATAIFCRLAEEEVGFKGELERPTLDMLERDLKCPKRREGGGLGLP